MDQTVTTLDNLARRVATQHDAMAAAITDERHAAAEVLARAVEVARPALRAISSRVLQERRTFWPTSVETATEETYHDVRGLRLAGDGPERDHPRANDGAIEGEDLLLLDDGRFVRLTWSGSWTRWQGRSSESRSELEILTLAEVVAGWDLDEILAALAKALEAQLSGRAEKTTKAATERAEKLRAVAALLGGAK